MTGCSVAKGLLEGHPHLTVTVLEARGLTRGASSRNGGHIVSPSFWEFPSLVEHFGPKAAVEIAEFTVRNCEKTFDAVEAISDPELNDQSEIRKVQKLIVLTTERHDYVRLVESEGAVKEFGLHNVAGVAVSKAGAVWPYRLWTGIWAYLQKKYPERLTIETYTPVTSVATTKSDQGPARYTIKTLLGDVGAAKVVYCTNAYSAHLLPPLRGKIFPIRGNMSAQDAGPDFPNLGASRSWSVISKRRKDLASGTQNYGLYYITRNPHTGHMFVGGEDDILDNLLSSDDSRMNPMSAKKVFEVLPKFYQKTASKTVPLKVWSGIMGFSKDGVPVLGPLPEMVTGRSEEKIGLPPVSMGMEQVTATVVVWL
ncbi:FAD dependent oxidoreductase [Tothia fuscella]|uniref:FAD dependent oxidoreductase n=1 Tax=Tothia fuscella TaxID=1048955 RepID=A0A9P4NFI6_9PEZI|nr:FAD dependent oxidoreductase [Tothia fuscella]